MRRRRTNRPSHTFEFELVLTVALSLGLIASLMGFVTEMANFPLVGRLPVSQTSRTIHERPDCAVQLTLFVSEGVVGFSFSGSMFLGVALNRGLNGRLELGPVQEQIAMYRRLMPDLRAVTVYAEDSVRYGDVVGVVDACLGGGLHAVEISTR
jgi:hypothetical protein